LDSAFLDESLLELLLDLTGALATELEEDFGDNGECLKSPMDFLMLDSGRLFDDEPKYEGTVRI
jgi:hypothetical protein